MDNNVIKLAILVIYFVGNTLYVRKKQKMDNLDKVLWVVCVSTIAAQGFIRIIGL